MKSMRSRLSRPLLLSTVAVFFLVTSVALAAALPKNSVGTKQLRKSAVTSEKIKTNSVTSSKVADQSLTGADIDESTLATVPSATRVESDLGFASARVQPSASELGFGSGLALATAVPLTNFGQIELYGKCFYVTGETTLYGVILMKTSGDRTIAIGTEDNYTGEPSFLGTSTSEAFRRAILASSSNNSYAASHEDFTIFGPDGRGASVTANVWVSYNNPLTTDGRQCVFMVDGERFTL